MRILVVDDNQHMRDMVSTILTSFGVGHVRAAGHGAQALSILKNWPAHVAIIDYQMAPMDGLELTRQIRNRETSPNAYLPIIMMTGYAERSRVIAARDAGVNEFLVKPITAKAVLDRLNALARRPREFVEAEHYFGPNRRRIFDLDHRGPRRRAEDAVAGA